MTSQLNVDTIVDKAGSGGTNVKIANNSVTVAEGGSATTTTVQGLNKFWMQTRGDLVTANIQDSFNSTSVTDVETGGIDTNFTNNMGNVNYAMSNCGMNGDHLVNGTDYTLTTACRFFHYNQSNSAADPGIAGYIVSGDLA